MLRKSDQTRIAVKYWFDILFTRGKRALVLAGLATSVTATLWSASSTGLDVEGRLEAAIYRRSFWAIEGCGRAVSSGD